MVGKNEETITIGKSTLYGAVVGILVILLIASIFTGGFGLNSNAKAVDSGIKTNPTPTPSPSPSPVPSPLPSNNPAGSKAALSIPSYAPYRGSDSANLDVI